MSEKSIPGWISFRVKPEEYQKIYALFCKSTHRKLSEYARHVLLQQPVAIRTKNESADELLGEILSLKKEMNAIGINYNQAVRKLYGLTHLTEVKTWLNQQDLLHQHLTELSEKILHRLNTCYQQWC